MKVATEMLSALRQEFRLFCVAVQFLTRWPIPSFPDFDVSWLSRSLRYFPVVGLCIAMLQWVLWYVLTLALPHPVALVWVMGFGLMLTGGFHEDGWADVCDGMGGAYERGRVLEIMKDSRVGAFGAMGLVWVLLSKWTVLSYLSDPVALFFALALAHGLSRLASTLLIVRMDHVGDAQHSKTKPLGNQMDAAEWMRSCALYFLLLLLMLLAAGLISAGPVDQVLRRILQVAGAAVIAASVCAVLAMRFFNRRIGGYTGDCLGATQQITEVSIYTAALAVSSLQLW